MFLVLSLAVAAAPKIAVTGSTGRLGRLGVQKLVNKGFAVRALLRHELSPEVAPSGDKNAEPAAVAAWLASMPGVELVRGDVTDPASCAELLKGCSACLALHGARRTRKLSDLWSDPTDTDPTHSKQVNYVGVANLIEAAKLSGTCQRIVRITGKGETPWSVPSILINGLGSMAKAWNYEGEQLLRAAKADVEYTIIRPGVMGQTDEVEPSSLALADDGGDLKVAPIAHSAVAELCVDCLESPNAACATLTAMTVPSGTGASAWKPLLADSVAPDRRAFRTDLMEEHRKAVRAGAVGGVALAAVLAGAAAFLLKTIALRLVRGVALATEVEPARLVAGLVVGLLVARAV